MNIDDVIYYLKSKESRIKYLENKVSELEEQIQSIKLISKINNSIDLKLHKRNYSRDEIITAYNKMLKYEGISEDRIDSLIIDTFIEFLNETHPSIIREK